MVHSNNPSNAWRYIVEERALDERVATDGVKDVLRPALLKGLCDHWPARQKWSSAEELVKHYPNLKVCPTRLVPVGEMGKALDVRIRLASYLRCVALFCVSVTLFTPSPPDIVA